MSWKSGSLNLLEPPGPHQACYGTPHPHIFVTHRFMECMYVLKFWEAFWHLSNAFNFRLPVKRLLIHSKKILLLTKYRRVLEVHFTVLLSTVPFKRMYITTQVIRVLLTVPWSCCVYNNLVLYWTLIDSYWHSHITKVLGKRQLVGGWHCIEGSSALTFNSWTGRTLSQ